MRYSISALAVGVAFAMTATAGASPAHYQMRLESGALEGPGAELITDRLATAQFILVGEDHGFADSPEIALALAKEARPFGVVNHVLEVGPLTGDWVVEILKAGGQDALGAAFAGRPLAAPFVNLKEDAALADYFVSNAPRKRRVLWGVDQEFIASPLIWFERLAAVAPTEAVREEFAKLLADERSAFASGDFGSTVMSKADDALFSEWRAEFAKDDEAQIIIRALEESAAIYREYNTGANYASNADRIAMIRRQFLERYSSAKGPAPRALFKMGANHLALGATTLSTFDLGSLTEGIAAGNGLSVLRILVLPLAGEQTRIAPSAESAFATELVHSDEAAGLLKAIGLMEEEIPDVGFSVIPLEPIRRALEQKGLSALSPDERLYILGFDFFVTTKSARAATPFALK